MGGHTLDCVLVIAVGMFREGRQFMILYGTRSFHFKSIAYVVKVR